MKKRLFVCPFVAEVAIVAAVAWSQAGSAEPLSLQVQETPNATAQYPPELGAAIGRLQSGDLQGAVQQIEEAVKNHPELPPAKALMADILFASQPAMAREFAEQAALESPEAPEPYGLLGDLARRERRWAEAELLYGRSLKAAGTLKDNTKREVPAELRAHKGLAAVAELHKQWPQMQKHAETALQLSPNDAIALQQLGQALFQQDKPEAALEKFRSAVKADPKLRAPEVLLALLYEKAGNRQKAAEWMIAALKANERDLRTRLEATQWAIDTGQLDQAKEQARSALVIDPHSLQAQMLRGLVGLLMKDYPAAEEWFQKVHLQDPNNSSVINNLALALIEQDDNVKKARALKYAQMNMRWRPQDPEVLSTYGWIAYKLGQINEAEAALTQASQAPGVGLDTLYYRARIAVDRKNTAMAKQLLEAALKSNAPFSKRQEAEQLLKELNL
jgi:Tfp pilus assembly protein PilF